MKKVLIIAYYFPPLGGGGTLRTVKFVKYLREFAWEPVVLTVKAPHYLAEDPWLESQLPEELQVYRSRAFLPGRFFRKTLNHSYSHADGDRESAPKRMLKSGFQFFKNLVYTFAFTPDEYIGWIPFAVKEGLQIIQREKIDAIYTTAPPNSLHLIGRKLHRKTGIPWVADFRDLWNQYPESYNPFDWRWKARLDDWFEKRVLKTCHKAIAVSETMKQELLSKYPDLPEKKVAVITNGFDPEDAKNLPSKKLFPGKFIVTHSGTLFAWRKTPELFEAIRTLVDTNVDFARDFKLVLIGIVHTEVRQEINRLKLNNWVHILPYRSYPEMMQLLKGSEVLLLIVGNQPHAGNVLTLKLFDYMNARRPILAIAPEGEVTNMVNNFELGDAVLSGSKTGVVKTLDYFFKKWKSGGLLGASKEDLSIFFRRNLSGQLAATLSEVGQV